MEIVAVAAVGENGVIGAGDDLPWDLPEESARYRERVADDPVVIGRRTYEMFDDLPGARQIVLSRSQRTGGPETVTWVTSPAAAIETAERWDTETLYVLGGAGIYEAFLPHCDRLFLSRVAGEHEGDAHFPDFERSAWSLVSETAYEGYTLEEWVREDA